MSEQPNALRLADEGERRAKLLRQEAPEWVAELRRLHEAREQDRRAMREWLTVLERDAACPPLTGKMCRCTKLCTTAAVHSLILQRLEQP